MTPPRVSIAMATYNGARYLGEQLQSFVDQTRQPDELVICDDGSSDDTLAIAAAFAANAPFRVLVERNPANLGYSANFSKAASLCTGDIIFLTDQDDAWFPTKIERSVAQLGAGTAVVLNDQQIVDDDGKTGGTVLGNVRALGFDDRTFVAGCCTAFTAEFSKLVLPFPKIIAFDNWVSLLADYLGIRSIIEEPLQLYRRHQSNTSQSIFAEKKPNALDLFARHGLSDPRAAWVSAIDGLDCYMARITERRLIAEALAGRAAVNRALIRIECDKQGLRRRLELLEKPRLVRWASVAQQYRGGLYDGFEGWKSAAKDVLRR